MIASGIKLPLPLPLPLPLLLPLPLPLPLPRRRRRRRPARCRGTATLQTRDYNAPDYERYGIKIRYKPSYELSYT